MIRGTRREDRLSRLQQLRPPTREEEAEAAADRRVLSAGGALLAVACLALLIRWLWP